MTLSELSRRITISRSHGSSKQSRSRNRRKRRHVRLPDTFGSPTYFLDNTNSCTSIADALRENGRKVWRFAEVFADPRTKDSEWMTHACDNGWIVISRDKRLLERTNALMIWKRRKGRIFVIASGDATGEQLRFAVLTALRKMESIIDKAEGPFAVRILVAGEVEMIKPEDLPLDFLG